VCKYSCINGESFGDLPELVFPQMRLACDVSRQAAFRYIAQSLAQFFVRNDATQHFNLHEKMIAKVLAHWYLYLSGLALRFWKPNLQTGTSMRSRFE